MAKKRPLRFVRSVVHYITGKRIYPKSAKAFPIFGKNRPKPNDKPDPKDKKGGQPPKE
jgi:hypothetical protein